MSKLATIHEEILSRKGMAQPMPATAPLVRANAHAVIDWQEVANSRIPLNLPSARATRRHNGDGRARQQAEPRVRVSLRLDRERHKRLAAFCAFVNRTQQNVLVQALNEFFARHGLDEAAGDRRRPIPE